MSRILIIDDDQSLADTCAMVLSAGGYRVAKAKDGSEGISVLQVEPADLILTDLQMPYGGIPAIRQLRKLHPKIPIIAMSGAPKPLELAGILGAHRTLAKPFTPADLLAAVAETLAKPPDSAPAE